jgi:hypothetical protein
VIRPNHEKISYLATNPAEWAQFKAKACEGTLSWFDSLNGEDISFWPAQRPGNGNLQFVSGIYIGRLNQMNDYCDTHIPIVGLNSLKCDEHEAGWVQKQCATISASNAA